MVRPSLLLVVFAAFATSAFAQAPGDLKLDRELRARAAAPSGHSRVIVQLDPGVTFDSVVRSMNGTPGRRLTLVDGQVADVPDAVLDELAALPGVRAISVDRRIRSTDERTSATIGADWVQNTLRYDGTGVGIAIIDSGVTSWHDDLDQSRVARFVDFVNFQASPYDDYGHGTHVAGIIAGNGYDSGGSRRGIAPGATLLVEKVLDARGQGYISNVIAALDYAVANKDALHLRVVNVSLAAGVYESYTSDPLTLAAKRAVEAGLVVVSAAGNLGRGPDGLPENGGIGAPGNAPWVLTVGSSSHQGTSDRSDDVVAGFSSRGPSRFDYRAKPDIVAPGVGIESLADPNSTLFATKPAMRIWGTVPTATEPYLSLSGTSMSAPVVSATIALMLQANPSLTPNLVKAILQFTAEDRSGYDALTEGAGFLNARGAVELAQALASGGTLVASTEGDPTPWSAHLIWGNHRMGGGALRAGASAWHTDVMWGSTETPQGANVSWGARCRADAAPGAAIAAGCDATDWSVTLDTAGRAAWGQTWDSVNVVWGTECGGADCTNFVWGSSTPRNAALAAHEASGMERPVSAAQWSEPARVQGSPPIVDDASEELIWRPFAVLDEDSRRLS
jgi:serine protease AprX